MLIRVNYIRLLGFVLFLGSLTGLGILYGNTFWNRGYSFGGIPRFLSYFTVLSNILGLVVSFQLMLPKKLLTIDLSPYATSYLLLTFLVYHFILRGIWAPIGWDLIGDILLHYLNPLLMVFILIGSGSKSHPYKIPISFVYQVLIFPALYFGITLIFGEYTKRYPYPFLNVANLGYQGVFRNAFFIALGFILVAVVVILLDWVLRWIQARKIKTRIVN